LQPLQIEVTLLLLFLAPRLNALLKSDELLLLVELELGFFLQKILLSLAVPFF
jgi:hypothetical protein